MYEAVLGYPQSPKLINWTIAQALRYHLKHSTYARTDFLAELQKRPTARQTSRHTVLHGVAVRYDRPINSLKLFLLLDAIHALASPTNGGTT